MDFLSLEDNRGNQGNLDRAIAIVDADSAEAYRLKARLMVRGYRRVDVYFAEGTLREAIRSGYRPDTVVVNGRPVARESFIGSPAL